MVFLQRKARLEEKAARPSGREEEGGGGLNMVEFQANVVTHTLVWYSTGQRAFVLIRQSLAELAHEVRTRGTSKSRRETDTLGRVRSFLPGISLFFSLLSLVLHTQRIGNEFEAVFF